MFRSGVFVYISRILRHLTRYKLLFYRISFLINKKNTTPETPWHGQNMTSLSATVLMPTSLLNFKTSLGKSPVRFNCRNRRVIFFASLILSPQPPHRPFSGNRSFFGAEAHLQFNSFPSEHARAIVCTSAAAVNECKKAVSRNTIDVKFFR